MNYPTGIKKNLETKKINYKNRGMSLENDINMTNSYYIEKEKAYIYKKPTPIKLVKVDYKQGKITEAYFDKPSTTDYNGIYKGQYIDFEAKETNNIQFFPIANIHPHQIKHIRNIVKEHGICFLIIRFIRLDETYVLMGNKFLEFIDHNETSRIPISYFKENGYLIKRKFIPSVDYLEIIDKLLEEK